MSTRSNIHLVSLGCPKNRVDSEVMLGVAEQHGYAHVDHAEEADVIVVNTCGFIESAKQESIDTILELAAYKAQGKCQRLIVAGCLSQKHGAELAEGLPEVDHFLGSSDMLGLAHALQGGADRLMVGNPADWVIRASDPRRLSTRGASAYLKIAEGCNRNCSFCIIPQLRGEQRSRSIDDIVTEAQRLGEAGVLELNLVSQDTIAYGRDRSDAAGLHKLLERLAEVDGLHWLRLFYLYPERLTEDVVELIRQHPKIVPYVDMPLQHAADGMLRRMRRGHGGQRLYELVERVRSQIDDVVFRTAFIVGHPGETEAEFQELCRFVEWAQFDRMGVFCYSDEETSASYTLADKVPTDVAEARARTLMDIQRPISLKKNQSFVGKELEVLVEGVSEESELVMMGRHAGQAPDIDGCVYLSEGQAHPGQLVRVKVAQATDYDLLGELPEDIDLPQDGTHLATSPQLVHKSSDGRRVTLRTVS